MTRVPRVAFRVDASAEIGLGHLRRCVTLAGRLRELGWDVRLVCREHFGAAVASLVAPHSVLWLEPEESGNAPRSAVEARDAEATLTLLEREGPGGWWVVVDSYRLGCTWERRIRERGHRVLVIDDFRDRRHHADIIVSEAELPFNPALNERGSVCTTLVGRNFAILGPEYAWRPDKVECGNDRPARVLISYGGSDPTEETSKAIEAVARLRASATGAILGPVEVVVGQLNPAVERIRAAAATVPALTIHSALPTLAPQVRRADLFLTAGGNSMVEALALRKPCLITITADNQAIMVEQLVSEGLIRLAGRWEQVAVAGLAVMMEDVLAGLGELRDWIAVKAPFDHHGPERIARHMRSWERNAGE